MPVGGNTTERNESTASADSEVPHFVVYKSCNDSSAMKSKVREENWHITEPFRTSMPSSCLGLRIGFAGEADTTQFHNNKK